MPEFDDNIKITPATNKEERVLNKRLLVLYLHAILYKIPSN